MNEYSNLCVICIDANGKACTEISYNLSTHCLWQVENFIETPFS